MKTVIKTVRIRKKGRSLYGDEFGMAQLALAGILSNPTNSEQIACFSRLQKLYDSGGLNSEIEKRRRRVTKDLARGTGRIFRRFQQLLSANATMRNEWPFMAVGLLPEALPEEARREVTAEYETDQSDTQWVEDVIRFTKCYLNNNFFGLLGVILMLEIGTLDYCLRELDKIIETDEVLNGLVVSGAPVKPRTIRNRKFLSGIKNQLRGQGYQVKNVSSIFLGARMWARVHLCHEDSAQAACDDPGFRNAFGNKRPDVVRRTIQPFNEALGIRLRPSLN